MHGRRTRGMQKSPIEIHVQAALRNRRAIISRREWRFFNRRNPSESDSFQQIIDSRKRAVQHQRTDIQSKKGVESVREHLRWNRSVNEVENQYATFTREHSQSADLCVVIFAKLASTPRLIIQFATRRSIPFDVTLAVIAFAP